MQFDSDSMEREVAHFRGDLSREETPESVTNFLNDSLGYWQIAKTLSDSPETTGVRPVLSEFHDNQELWMRMGQMREGHKVFLSSFWLTEWAPLAPGRYFTNEAYEARQRAKEYWSWTNGEYYPAGKAEMVLGGIGSTRLKAMHVAGSEFYLLGASSNGISHQGITVAVPERIHDSVRPYLERDGVCVADVVGRLRVPPKHTSLVITDRAIPKFYLFAEDVRVRGRSLGQPLVSLSVMFSGSYYRGDSRGLASETLDMDGYTTDLRKQWTFCSFNPQHGNDALAEAADWLEQYAGRYSGEAKPILSDFDEHINHFSSPIEFPLGQIVHGNISVERLSVYGDFYGFQVNAESVFVEGDSYSADQVAALGRQASASNVTLAQTQPDKARGQRKPRRKPSRSD